MALIPFTSVLPAVWSAKAPMPDTVAVSLGKLESRRDLEALWRELESRSDASLFTRWSWIGSWLDNLPAGVRPQLLVARRRQQVVGLGLVTLGRVKLLKAVPVRCWLLHSCGDTRRDGMTIEYNGFLVDRSVAKAVREAMFEHLVLRTAPGRVEMFNADSDHADLASTCAPGTIVREYPSVSYQVALDQVRAAPGGYVDLLSANTRSQLRRSLKAYTALGELQVHEPRDLEEAMQYFHRLRELHAQAWQRRGEWSDFGFTPEALAFHERFIARAFPRGEVQLMRICAGEREVGYLYNLVDGANVLFYQSGLNFGLLDKHDRPGMMCHLMAVQHNARLGHALYDFLAGDYRYKASLSTHFKRQASCLFQKAKPLARFDQGLRKRVYALRQRRRTAALANAASSAGGASGAVAETDSGPALTSNLIELR